MQNFNSILIQETLQKGIEELSKAISEAGKETLNDISKDAKQAWEDFLKKIREKKTPDYIVAEDVEFLNSKTLLEIAKKYIVKGSNEVYVMRKQEKYCIFVYLAYGKDKTILEKEQNKYVVIKAEGVSADILGMFDNTELVILK